MSKATWLCGLASILALFACGPQGQGGGSGGSGGSGAAAQGGAGAGQGGAGQGGLGQGGAGPGGEGGPYKACKKPADCDDPVDPVYPCRQYLCEFGYCDYWNPLSWGTPVADKMPGDCQSPQCFGEGSVRIFPDATDVPADDGDPCTIEACIEGADGSDSTGTPAHLPAEPGTTCGPNKICDGDGACVDIP